MLCRTDLRIANHSGHKFPPSLTLLSFKTRTKWPLVMTAIARFLSIFFEFLQYPRQHPRFSDSKNPVMTKSDLIFPAFSSTFVGFTVQFCYRCKFLFLCKILAWPTWHNYVVILPCRTKLIVPALASSNAQYYTSALSMNWTKINFEHDYVSGDCSNIYQYKRKLQPYRVVVTVMTIVYYFVVYLFPNRMRSKLHTYVSIFICTSLAGICATLRP